MNELTQHRLDMHKYEIIRNSVTNLLKEFSCFEYKGHGMQIGIWETEDFQSLTKPVGDSFWSGKFRLWVFVPDQNGQQIKVEVFLMSVYEWETVFEGYIENVTDISKILNFQLGLPKKAG